MARTLRAVVNKSNVRDKLKLAVNPLDEVQSGPVRAAAFSSGHLHLDDPEQEADRVPPDLIQRNHLLSRRGRKG